MKCKDKEGYYYYTTLSNIKDKRTKNLWKVSKNNPYSIQNIKNFIYLNNSKAQILSKEYSNNKQNLLMKCECGELYSISWTHLYETKKFHCDKCSGTLRSDTQRTSIKEVQKELCKYKLKLVKPFKTIHKLHIEDSSGYRYVTSIYNIRENKQNSQFLSINPYFIFNLNLYLELNNINLKVLNFYKTKEKTRLKCQCKCGEIFYPYWYQVLNGRTRCEFCTKSMSSLEHKVKVLLDELNIEYIQEKIFDDCKFKRSLRFDFYLPKQNIVIETHGIQHYKYIPFFEEPLALRQYKDRIKVNYCIDKDIKVLVIPYTAFNDTKDYKKLIYQFLK